MHLFNEFIADANLSDLPLSNGLYTWSNMRESPYHSLIDRFLCSEAFLNHFPNALVKRLDRELSDHYPIQVSLGINKWGPAPFRFENMWMQHPSFSSMLELWWILKPLTGWPGHGFIQKPKSLKATVRLWKKETFGCIHRQREQCLINLASLDAEEERGTIQQEQIANRTALKAQLLSLAVKEEAHWRQRCKTKWLTEGDVNSSFFHRLVAARRRRSTIVEVLSREGRSLTEDRDIEQEFLSFYEDLYTKKPGYRFLPHPLNWDPISPQQRDLLELPFTETEIWATVKDLGHNKSPGPDGFTAEFYKKILEHSKRRYS